MEAKDLQKIISAVVMANLFFLTLASAPAGSWFEAVNASDIPGMKYLLNEGADVNAQDEYGKTALLLAAFNGKTEVVKFLIENGADVNAKTTKCEPLFYDEGSTALMAPRIKYEIAELLIEKGADVNAGNYRYSTALMRPFNSNPSKNRIKSSPPF